MEYDPDTSNLKTVSLHCFEDDSIKVVTRMCTHPHVCMCVCVLSLKGALLNNCHRPYLRVEPEEKCAAMIVYGTHLAILPFRQSSILDDHAHGHTFLDDSQPATPMSAR